ncbi:MAG TPA: hypothetical protein VFT67_01765 [Jatrophihabitantaceae bacterium]|nr:hypothetical protein [Jatrophihabitantaceae bacterium]
MNTDQTLIDLFAERAEQRPDASDVLAALRRAIDAPRHGNMGRTATMLGSAAAVAALAIGVSVATSGGHGAPDPQPVGAAVSGGLEQSNGPAQSGSPEQSGPVPGTPTLAPVSSADTHAPGTPAGQHLVEAPGMGNVPGSRDYSTIAAGWLPGPAATRVEASNQPGFEERIYTVTVDGVEMDAIIYVEDGPLPGRTEAGSQYRSLTINGHPAREFVADTATIVAVDLGNGKIAYAGPSVAATTAQVTTDRITAIAEHMAASMQFGRHDPIG